MRDAGVLLLHGMGRTSASMAHMARALARAGFRTLNLDYPSRTRDLAALADHVQARAGGWSAASGGGVHVVTHSMGGLVARAWIARHAPAGVARIVMLAPPNQGSEIADLLGRSRAYRGLFGAAGAQLGTRRDAATAALLATPCGCEIGVIAGTRTLDPLGWLVLPKPNDGKVSVASTRLEGMTDHLLLPVTHTFLMHDPQVVAATIAFLRDGRFPRRGTATPAGRL
ncbi:Alpha/beta hydrolase [Beijerinckiaceae bacterium RH AL1]|nr:alpha/beta fold hydrolase [Beijerinckiaceae bacterium]VVB47591.1 Alpha/beta hydrolase [Beijerinckiaceae bacterium RH CH11]VVB47672.1 Alpha/beta hydrolase [Beijerinckiaceae bacterium RH AL8]VVC55967.1 Alpha/beta hydrolase [Beijerinckiaceae bacterium RH AL1]